MHGRTARVGFVAALLAIATLTATISVVWAPAQTRAAPAPVEALLIGDSVLNGLAQGYGAPGRAALAARHSFAIDSAGCRRLITTSCRIPPGSAPTNAITVLRERAGQYDRALVIAAGYDDPPTGEFGIGAAVDTIIAEARRQGIDHVIWLTYREAGSAGNVARYQQSNALLRSRRDPELLLADWATRSSAMPANWFSGDGIHLGAQAVTAMAELIADALDQLVPVRCTSGIWSGGDLPSAPSSPGVAVGGGVELMARPVRFVDTRSLPGKLGAGRVLTVPIAGVDGVPIDAAAVVVSVTAVEPCGDTFLTLYPCGTVLPTASTVNAVALSIVANSAVVRLGGGALCIFTLRPTDVLVDVSGWVAPTGMRSLPVAPLRLVDTRPGEPQALPAAQRRLGPGQLLAVDVAAVHAGATGAATVNVTAAAPDGGGFISVLPGPCANVNLPPSTSNLNVTAGHDVAASATVALGNGELCVFTSTGSDVVVDLQALHGVVGNGLTAVDPHRILDTRTTGRLGRGQTLPVEIGTIAAAAIVNLTAVDPSGNGFLTLYPCGAAIPTASNLNVVAGDVLANRAVVSTGASSRFCVYSSVDTDVVIDVEAYISD
jgi:hypothetical protein